MRGIVGDWRCTSHGGLGKRRVWFGASCEQCMSSLLLTWIGIVRRGRGEGRRGWEEGKGNP